MKMNRISSLMILASVVASLTGGCTKKELPCPQGVLAVSQQEADEGLRRRAQKEVDAGKKDDIAATFECGYDEVTPGMYRAVAPITLNFGEVMVCVVIAASNPPMTLTDCMVTAARAKMAAKSFWKEPTSDMMAKAVEKSKCTEVSREGEVEADKHSLNRDGSDKWVEVLLGAAVIADRMIGAAMAPATAAFSIRLGAGEETTCYDTPSGPSKGCLAEDGCGGAPPGATPPGGSSSTGGVIPPGTTPGVPPDGDHL